MRLDDLDPSKNARDHGSGGSRSFGGGGGGGLGLLLSFLPMLLGRKMGCGTMLLIGGAAAAFLYFGGGASMLGGGSGSLPTGAASATAYDTAEEQFAGRVLASTASADYDAGVAAFTAGDYAAAIAEWRPLAEQGDAASQYGMGLIYETGRGIGRDYTQAAGWYLQAAEQGHPGAQFNLGHLYRLGLRRQSTGHLTRAGRSLSDSTSTIVWPRSPISRA